MSERASDVLRHIDRHLDRRDFVSVPVPTDSRYPIGLMKLPVDLTRAEAERIRAMVDAWCPEITGGAEAA